MEGGFDILPWGWPAVVGQHPFLHSLRDMVSQDIFRKGQLKQASLVGCCFDGSVLLPDPRSLVAADVCGPLGVRFGIIEFCFLFLLEDRL